MLAYKSARHGGELVVADRWFASSQIHHGCTAPDGTPCRLVGKGRIDKSLGCPHTGDVVDRDHNAARNLRDWPEPASCGPVRTTAPSVPGPTTSVGTGHGADAGSSGAGGAPRRPHPGGAGSGEARTQTPQGDAARACHQNTLNGNGSSINVMGLGHRASSSANAQPIPCTPSTYCDVAPARNRDGHGRTHP
jgi:putative transposase